MDYSKIAAAVRSSGLSYGKILELSDPEINQILYPPTKNARKEPNWEEVYEQLKIRHMTLLLAYDHYRANYQGQKFYSYSSFCRKLDEWKKTHLPPETYTNLDVIPADRLEIDFAGDPLTWVDENSKIHKTRLFVATLPCSGMIYAQAFPDEKQGSWIQGTLEALEYFGGVPNTLIMDNAKAFFIRARTDCCGDIQPVVLDFCHYYGMQADTCAPASPKQKNRVEVSVCMVERWITGKLQLQQKGPVLAANEANLKALVRERLDALNDRPWQGRGETRRACFIAEEKALLKPLPSHAYAYGTWKVLRVDKGHCIRLNEDGGHRYSVPSQYVGKKMQVKLTQTEVKIFDQDSCEMITAHQRRYNTTGEKTHLLTEHLTDTEKITRQMYWGGLLTREITGFER